MRIWPRRTSIPTPQISVEQWLRAELSLWAPVGVIALVAAFSVEDFGWPHSKSSWLFWVTIVLVGLAVSVGRRERKLGLPNMPLDRVALWTVFGLWVFAWFLSGSLQRMTLMIVTGVLGFVVAVEMADRIPMRHEAVLDRLFDRGVLAMTRKEARKAYSVRLERHARICALVGSLITAALLLVMWIVALGPGGNPLRNPFALFECLCAWIAGGRLGQMIAYGKSWRLFKRQGAQWRLIPKHPDRAGGFKPIGDFFLYESVILAIPAIYLTAWSLIRPPPPGSPWQVLYLFLLAIVIVLEVEAVFVPMRSIHALMREQKTLFLAHADQLSREIDWLQQRLCEQRSTSERQQIKDYIADLTDACKRIEKVPAWPFDPSVRRRFGLSQIATFLPFVTFALNLSQRRPPGQ